MKPTRCPRVFEVEAARDGRLTGVERASFERHMTGCPSCRREAKALEGLADALRVGSREDGDELHVRRERTRLLAAFDHSLVAGEPRSSMRRRLLLPAAVVALVASVLVFERVRSAAPPAPAPGAIVHADGTAVWSQQRDGNRERLVLDHGALWIHVEHVTGEEHLVVVLPDGELEDTGTTFTVSAEEGRTTRVAVQEGAVVLRIRGQPSVAVGAGDSWTPEARPAGSRSERAAFAPPSPSAPPRVSPPSASALDPDPSADFRAAMAALDSGHLTEAAAAFSTFLVKHPGDRRAEDAAYLRVIALQRSGDGPRTRQAAGEYLRRYPAGFRHAEMETLSR